MANGNCILPAAKPAKQAALSTSGQTAGTEPWLRLGGCMQSRGGWKK
eukprot:CAMPEP_0181190948 /NCGR_PEP_ID=MMETSP1096-20121128/12468_1 /TAXON_ID=156174 ORGANISM="Chrysochromulina ericina, Strain CCMP281" /NCGR_SAMPLE_ID=MMETSP1096 /ASSEMBLY_ACC=CAM_ASM_000453 /LENGTH=46 /DNA_ID= /DNA_START= /DNA_END= /DNA_ORIENTATION=